uniref:Uncharacterized protein n=1 Tax=Strigamia maritima TaxID=126957 RepID=T1IHU0_STRMM
MKRTHVLSLFLWMLLASAACNVLQTADVDETAESIEQQQSNQNSFLGGMNSEKASNSRDISDALKEVIASGNWERFTPAPVKHVNCHVEVQVVQKIPGRCIHLGLRRIPACQTQNWVSFNSEDCESQ